MSAGSFLRTSAGRSLYRRDPATPAGQRAGLLRSITTATMMALALGQGIQLACAAGNDATDAPPTQTAAEPQQGLSLAPVVPETTSGQTPPLPPPAAAGAVPAASKPAVAAVPAPRKPGRDAGPMTTETFLDKLMMAESGGRSDARNPRSTALGPFQFIEATFLEVTRRHFASDLVGLSDIQVLSLRTDPEFSRKAAAAFSRDNAAALAAESVATTFPNLRLAFLLGPAGAIRVLQASPEYPVGPLVGAAVVLANPFMAGMTAGDLAARAARDLALPAPRFIARSRYRPPGSAVLAAFNPVPLPSSPIAHGRPAARASIEPPNRAASVRAPDRRATTPRRPTLTVLCNRDLPSCRRWIVLQSRLLAARAPSTRGGLASSQR